MTVSNLKKTAHNIRKNMLKVLVPMESHHIGCSLSIVDILTYLYFDLLRVDPKDPKSSTRDIFLLSKGHAGLALYSTLFEKGFFLRSLLDQYDTNGGLLPEHASVTCPGVELSTGSLGHALPVGLGFALSYKNDNKSNQVYVLLSDGELNEGSNWEAFMFAGFHRLDNLNVIVDKNGFQGYAETQKVIDLSPIMTKVMPFGWNGYECDGHDFSSLQDVFKKIKGNKNGKPNLVVAKTIKGKGVPYFEGRFDSHYKSVDEETKKEILSSWK